MEKIAWQETLVAMLHPTAVIVVAIGSRLSYL